MPKLSTNAAQQAAAADRLRPRLQRQALGRQWRIVFRWENGNVYDVQVVDYHRRCDKMLPENRIPTHPGVVLEEEFLIPLGLTQVALAKHLGVPTQRINELIRGKRGVTPQTAWLLAGAFKTTPQFWLNLQANYDLAMNRPKQEIQPLALAA